MRIGFGYDIHPLKKGRPLFLGGVKVNSDRGLEGHSDADVVIHSIMDALLGASGQGDIGVHFPNDEISWKGISSMVLLNRTCILLEKKKYKIKNLDITIVVEKPKLLTYYPDMIMNIASALKISEDCINIKATTNEGIGFIGKGEGIASFCVTLLEES
ncbi:MAG TPA: 2-C-methyl-D-erythritol 2,4-cyclodiphosphate synthase [Atribacterota bacterium]|nr:2-C-methyl-D-erythritol 2,4-cyclodiphosphate synthase [Atribacterota bacterium]